MKRIALSPTLDAHFRAEGTRLEVQLVARGLTAADATARWAALTLAEAGVLGQALLAEAKAAATEELFRPLSEEGAA